MKYIKFLFLGAFFGMILIQSEVVSWFRIQEMFRFQSFHMYGIIGSAVVVGAISISIIKGFNLKTILGEDVKLNGKTFNKGTIIGGMLFGMGWALTGACPGPLYALLGAGLPVIIVVILSAILGVYVYGALRDRLPH